MLFYKNNYSSAVDCWVNGQYQGVIPAHSTKYMPVEGFVTRDSRWLADGTLYQRNDYGGWSPSSPSEVITVVVPRIGQPTMYWKGTFTAAETGSYLKAYNMVKDGTPIDALDVEFAEGMPKGDPKDLALLANDGSALEAMVEVPVSITLDSPTDGDATEERVTDVSGGVSDPDMTSVIVSVNGRETKVPVVDGRFTAKITLTVGKNTVKVRGGRDAVSESVVVKCTDKPSRLWVELVWDGPGDVDLHVRQPSGQEVYYSNAHPRGGGNLDVDNTRGYGPEHYFISAERGDDVESGDYEVFLVHYHSSGPVRCRVTIFKDETLFGTYTADLNGSGQRARIETVSF